MPPHNVRDLIRSKFASLSKSERLFANALLDNYPSAGLAAINRVAENTGVSSPTIARAVKKLGFSGYPEFHKALLSELEAKASSPTERRAHWIADAPETHLLNRFAKAVSGNIEKTLSNIETRQFNEAARLLADVTNDLYLVGGRITKSMAEYAFTHFQAVRGRVTYLTSSSGTWPHYVLDMKKGDTLLIFDIRRYESNLLKLTEIAKSRDVNVILVTDQWVSPIADVADFSFCCWVEIPSAWDSNISVLMLVEVLISAAQEINWEVTEKRYKSLDELFDMSKLFLRG